MGIVSSFASGLFAVLKVTASPMLYRYPYRTSADGLRGDMNRVGEDMFAALNRLHPKDEPDDERHAG